MYLGNLVTIFLLAFSAIPSSANPTVISTELPAGVNWGATRFDSYSLTEFLKPTNRQVQVWAAVTPDGLDKLFKLASGGFYLGVSNGKILPRDTALEFATRDGISPVCSAFRNKMSEAQIPDDGATTYWVAVIFKESSPEKDLFVSIGEYDIICLNVTSIGYSERIPFKGLKKALREIVQFGLKE